MVGFIIHIYPIECLRSIIVPLTVAYSFKYIFLIGQNSLNIFTEMTGSLFSTCQVTILKLRKLKMMLKEQKGQELNFLNKRNFLTFSKFNIEFKICETYNMAELKFEIERCKKLYRPIVDGECTLLDYMILRSLVFLGDLENGNILCCLFNQ